MNQKLNLKNAQRIDCIIKQINVYINNLNSSDITISTKIQNGSNYKLASKSDVTTVMLVPKLPNHHGDLN